MQVTLSQLIKDWFDEHEFCEQFITEYPGRDSLIVRHPATNKTIIVIMHGDMIVAYFDAPVQLKAQDPQLFWKLDQALRRFVDRI